MKIEKILDTIMDMYSTNTLNGTDHLTIKSKDKTFYNARFTDFSYNVWFDTYHYLVFNSIKNIDFDINDVTDLNRYDMNKTCAIYIEMKLKDYKKLVRFLHLLDDRIRFLKYLEYYKQCMIFMNDVSKRYNIDLKHDDKLFKRYGFVFDGYMFNSNLISRPSDIQSITYEKLCKSPKLYKSLLLKNKKIIKSLIHKNWSNYLNRKDIKSLIFSVDDYFLKYIKTGMLYL